MLVSFGKFKPVTTRHTHDPNILQTHIEFIRFTIKSVWDV